MARVKISDYIMRRLEEYGVKDMFLLSGGGMMHLLDSVARSNINYYCNLHEQAAAIAADGYAQISGGLGVCMVTTGPGGTNAVTGCAASWVDSVPVLFISGQVRRDVMIGGSGLRQVGDQEINIVDIVKPITKYAVTVMDEKRTGYHLEKAIYLATHGRKGPVWIDVPLDIQGALLEESDMICFDSGAEGLEKLPSPDINKVRAIRDMLLGAERPLLLIGGGVAAAGAEDAFRTLAGRLGVPVMTTWRARGALAFDDEYFFGSPGAIAPRYSNFILQKADCVVMLGMRPNVAITGYNERDFARFARKAYINIDSHEIEHFSKLMEFDCMVQADAGEFIRCLLAETRECDKADAEGWIDYCKKARDRFGLHSEKQVKKLDFADFYLFCRQISAAADKNDVIVSASAGRASLFPLSYCQSEGQMVLHSTGLGSMGFGLPQAIGACIAKKGCRTLLVEGDGSMQHNLQELALIHQYKLPIKLFYVTNEGYASIKFTQDNHFGGNYAGCNSESGVGLPDAKKIAALYDLPYFSISSDDQMGEVLSRVMKDDEPALCELFVDKDFQPIPRTATRVSADGTISSSGLVDLYPFLPEEEIGEWLEIDRGN